MSVTTRAEGTAQAIPADATRFYAGSGRRLFGYVRCACPGCRSAQLLSVPSISREILTPPRKRRRAGILAWLARRNLERVRLPLGWMRLEAGNRRRQHFDVCSWRCLHRLSEFL